MLLCCVHNLRGVIHLSFMYGILWGLFVIF